MKEISNIIDEIQFRTALIIDNRREDVKPLEKDLEDKGISVVTKTNSTDAEYLIKNRPEFDLIILDWFLDEENDDEAKYLLDLLKNQIFAPIIIYTNKGVEGPSLFLKERRLERVTTVLDKAQIDGETVFKEITKWLTNNPELAIFLRWSFEVENKLNNSLWEIHDLEVEGLSALIDLLDQPQGESKIPKEKEIINLFDNVLQRKLSNSNEEFFSYVADHISKLQKAKETHPIDVEKLMKFHRFERYKSPILGSISTGDILKNEKDEYFILVTPSCDLCHPEKIENILLLRAEPFNQYRKKRNLENNKAEPCICNKPDIVHYLPYAANLPYGLICRFDHILSIKLPDLKKEIKDGKIQCVETIDSPFIEYLIQRMNAYMTRLGARDLAKAEIEKILHDTSPN